MKNITSEQIDVFKKYLFEEEKKEATISKYIHDIKCFKEWLNDQEICKAKVLEYKKNLVNIYAPRSVNTIIASLNSFFNYLGWYDLKIKNIKIQKQIYLSKNKELTKEEYFKLLNVAKEKNKRLYLLIQTICSTGIRVSEVKYVTVEAVEKNIVTIDNKGKIRLVFLPIGLCQLLKEYIKEEKIKSGIVFVTKNNKPLDRSNIWSSMKKLCKCANVNEEKVFPHNLRHLFARTYYSSQKDIVRLSDILGHSSINTTRIYTMESGEIHKKQIQELGLLQY